MENALSLNQFPIVWNSVQFPVLRDRVLVKDFSFAMDETRGR